MHLDDDRMENPSLVGHLNWAPADQTCSYDLTHKRWNGINHQVNMLPFKATYHFQDRQVEAKDREQAVRKSSEHKGSFPGGLYQGRLMLELNY